MLYKGLRDKVPHARYNKELTYMETMHCTYAEYLAEPWDLVVEENIRIQKRAIGEAYRNKTK